MLENRLNKLLKKISEIDDLEELDKFSKDILNINVRVNIEEQKYVSNLKTFIKNILCRALMEREKQIIKTSTKLPLTHIFSQHLIDGIDIAKLDLRGHTRSIGVIPRVFFEKSNNPKDTAIKLFELFSKYSMLLNYDYKVRYPSFDGEKQFIKNNVSNFEKEFFDITNHNVKLEFIGSGFNGNGFKLSFAGHTFCYKTFFIYNLADVPLSCCHGTLAEAQMALFATANSRKGLFSKFYFGKVGYKYNIDSFLITEFIDKNISIIQDSNFYIDHITSRDLNIRNRVSGKIIDFGAIKIAIPELCDKKLCKLVRIICQCIRYSFNEETISYHWYLSKNKLIQLHNYIQIFDEDFYQRALDIILKYTSGMPLLLQNIFRDLKYAEPDCKYVFDVVLNTNQLFVLDVPYLKSNLEFFDILKTETKPMAIFNSPGHIIVELFNGYQAVCFYRDEVEKIRIEKLEDNSFVSLLEVTKDDFDNYQNRPMYELLKDLSEFSNSD